MSELEPLHLIAAALPRMQTPVVASLPCSKASTAEWVIRYAGVVRYEESLRWQEELVARKLRGDSRNYLLLLEHPAVYTIGRGGSEADLGQAPARYSIPVFRVGRGGGATFHGPGQLVAYPIMRLWRQDVRWYVQQLEAALVAVCQRFGLVAYGGSGRGEVGVWVGTRKIASIGLGIRKWVTFHGVALNVSTDTEYFRAIIPCRQPGLEVTSLARELGWSPALERVALSTAQELLRVLVPDREDAT